MGANAGKIAGNHAGESRTGSDIVSKLVQSGFLFPELPPDFTENIERAILPRLKEIFGHALPEGLKKELVIIACRYLCARSTMPKHKTRSTDAQAGRDALKSLARVLHKCALGFDNLNVYAWLMLIGIGSGGRGAKTKKFIRELDVLRAGIGKLQPTVESATRGQRMKRWNAFNAETVAECVARTFRRAKIEVRVWPGSSYVKVLELLVRELGRERKDSLKLAKLGVKHHKLPSSIGAPSAQKILS